MRDFLNQHDIPCPQFDQGQGYKSEFSKSWGVGSAPAMFILDRQGRLRSTEVHNDTAAWIDRLLAE